LILAAAARVNGEQTINRAELMAIAELNLLVEKGIILSDSAYAIHAFTFSRQARCQLDFRMCDHLDLHQFIWDSRLKEIEIKKVARPF